MPERASGTGRKSRFGSGTPLPRPLYARILFRSARIEMPSMVAAWVRLPPRWTSVSQISSRSTAAIEWPTSRRMASISVVENSERRNSIPVVTGVSGRKLSRKCRLPLPHEIRSRIKKLPIRLSGKPGRLPGIEATQPFISFAVKNADTQANGRASWSSKKGTDQLEEGRSGPRVSLFSRRSFAIVPTFLTISWSARSQSSRTEYFVSTSAAHGKTPCCANVQSKIRKV
jgi:hypothetical protein